ncbi:MAG TPA: DUF2064 domain-containing protein [Acidimicrobiales bacterium]|jgi:hypothetical protein|nr:DUF2064 domain-containing protein [Acidimicrobiales bacterium]
MRRRRGVHVMVMAKAPRAGLVKTRLCPPFTPAEAAAVAEAAVRDTLAAVAATGADRRIIALDGPVGPWLPSGFEIIEQCQGTLDVRLAHAWDQAGGPGVQIGMDTPQVTPDLLHHALGELARPDVDSVLGDACDGGWWIIGLRRPSADVFLDVPMSAPDTGARQHARLRTLGLRVSSLPTLRDLDSIEDALHHAEIHPHTRTANVLRSIASSTTRA